MIKITVGGERREIKENTTVEELLPIENAEMPEYVSVSSSRICGNPRRYRDTRDGHTEDNIS